VALRWPPVDIFDQPTELNGILAFTPDEATIRITYPCGLLPPNVKAQPRAVRGVGCSEMLGVIAVLRCAGQPAILALAVFADL
jgi:hypothetical protein